MTSSIAVEIHYLKPNRLENSLCSIQDGNANARKEKPKGEDIMSESLKSDDVNKEDINQNEITLQEFLANLTSRYLFSITKFELYLTCE